MDERERVDELDRERRRQHLLDRRAERLRRPRARSPDGRACRRPRASSAPTSPGRAAPARARAARAPPRRAPSARQGYASASAARLRRSSSSSTAFASSESSPRSSIARSARRRPPAESCSSSARAASSRASSSSALRQRLVSAHAPLPHDPPEDPVHQSRRVLGCIPLRERHRLVEHDLDRHLALVELLERDAEDVPLDGAEPVGGPVVGRGRDPRVELLRVRGHGVREPLRCTRRRRRRRASRAAAR